MHEEIAQDAALIIERQLQQICSGDQYFQIAQEIISERCVFLVVYLDLHV